MMPAIDAAARDEPIDLLAIFERYATPILYAATLMRLHEGHAAATDY